MIDSSYTTMIIQSVSLVAEVGLEYLGPETRSALDKRCLSQWTTLLLQPYDTNTSYVKCDVTAH